MSKIVRSGASCCVYLDKPALHASGFVVGDEVTLLAEYGHISIQRTVPKRALDELNVLLEHSVLTPEAITEICHRYHIDIKCLRFSAAGAKSI